MKVIEKIWESWKVLEEIGRGSYGTVYKCFKEENGVKEYSAIKVISIPQSEYEMSEVASEKMTNEQSKAYYKDIADDLVKEIEILKALKGTKNIVEIYDAEVEEKEEGIGWYILIRMELLTNFNTYSSDKNFTEAEAIKLGLDLSSALSVCHKAKIIHRDIKPENIFVDAEGNFKLGDFGVAKQMEKTQGSMSVKGTYNYMSPEVFGGKKSDGRADMYSLALVMYKLLNNDRLPFLDPNKQIVRYSERQEAFERRIKGEELPAINGASKELNAIILKACSFKNTDRQKNIDEFRGQLEKVLKGQKVRQKPKKSTVKKTVVAIFVVIILIILAGLWYGITEMGLFEKAVVIEVEDPSIISIDANEMGLTTECIDNKYLYKDTNGVFVFDKTTNEKIFVYGENEVSCAFNGNNVVYATYSQIYREDSRLLICTWNLFDVDEQINKTIEVRNYYDSTSTDIVYFNDNHVLYKSYDNSGRRALMMFDFKTSKTKTVGYSIGENILVYDNKVLYTTDEKDSSLSSTIWCYDVDKQSGVLLTSEGCFQEQAIYYQKDCVYFFDWTLKGNEEGSTTVFELCKYDFNKGKEELISALSDYDSGFILALNEKYVGLKNGDDYYLWLNDKHISKSIRITDEYGEFIDCFVNPELTDKIIMSFKNELKYQYYEVLRSGKLKLLGEIVYDTSDMIITKDTVYSVTGDTEEKSIKVYDMQ